MILSGNVPCVHFNWKRKFKSCCYNNVYQPPPFSPQFYNNPQFHINENPRNYINDNPRNYLNENPRNYLNENPRNYINDNPRFNINENPRNYINETQLKRPNINNPWNFNL